MDRKGAPVSEVIQRLAPEGVKSASNVDKFYFSQQPTNSPSGMPSHAGEKGSKIPKTINLASTGLRRSFRLDNNPPPKKNGLFDKLSLAVIGLFEVDKNPHIFLTRSNKHIQEINIYFYGTLNNFVPMVFPANKEQN